MRCKERKDPRFFVSPWEVIREWVDSHSYLTPPNDHKTSQPIVLCTTCLDILRIKSNKIWHNRKPKNRLCGNIKTGIYKGFKTGKPGRWESRVGYSLAELREHLQSQFTAGMSWSNYGQWHIDHIKTVASFDFSKYDDGDFRRCWSLSNLRPLWAMDNWMRSKKQNPMRECFDKSRYASCLDCPQTVHIKYRGRFCQRFRRWVPEWWETQTK